MKTKLSVIGIVFDSSHQQILVVKRRDVPIWTLPGGGVEPNETPEEAVVREIFEETHLKTKISRKTAEYFPINRLSNDTHVFACEVAEGIPHISDETEEVQFFPLNALPSPFFPLHQFWLEDALQNPTQIVKKPIDQVTYKALFSYFLEHPLHVLRFLISKLGLPINSKSRKNTD